MMVMTLCLIVYNVGQYQLRKKLAAEKETLPNQLGQEVKTPTLRWIFQIMEGIGIIRFYEEDLKRVYKEMITNISKLWMYGLIQKNCLEV